MPGTSMSDPALADAAGCGAAFCSGRCESMPPARSACPKSRRVKSGRELQAALHCLQPGDVLELQAGAPFTGNFILRTKPGTAWIYIRSSAHALLPPPGTHVFPSHARLMARIDTPNRAPAIRT